MSDFWNGLPGMPESLQAVRRRMIDALGSDRFPLASAVKELIEANGKLLRPAFVIMGGRFGKEQRNLIDLAAAIELLHIATLIHDDVIDESDTRRGVESVNARYGAKHAVLTGDWLFSRSFRLVTENAKPQNARLLASLVQALVSEEIHQDLERFTWPKSQRNYLRKIGGKTAALFSLALRAGALETKSSPLIVTALVRTGYNVGMAFQIMDDILDYESSADTMGKPVAKDVRDGLCTLPLILTMRLHPETILPLLGQERPDEASVSAIVEVVRQSGAIDSAKTLAQRYTERAMLEISRLPKGVARDELCDTVEKLLTRKY